MLRRMLRRRPRNRLVHNAAMTPFSRSLFLVLIVACLGLAACQTPVPPVPAKPQVSPQQRLAAVAAAAGVDDTELDVQPLRDPQVEDLRARAQQAQAAGDYARAAADLDLAIGHVADDPAVLQERAEVALALGDYAKAETLARQAFDLGSRVGPLCRRHWATIEQSRLAREQPENAASAQAQIASCTVPGLIRM